MRKTHIFTFVLTAIFLTACAGFKGKELDYVSQKDIPQSQNKPSLQVAFKFEQFVNGSKTQIFRESAESSLHTEFMSIAENSGNFSQVSEDLESPDLRLDINLKDEGRANMGMAVLTGLSLYTIPSFATDNYILTANIENQSGKKWTITLEDYVTQWQHILLVPVMPFKLTPVVADDVQDNMFRTLILRMQKEGIVEPKKVAFNLKKRKTKLHY